MEYYYTTYNSCSDVCNSVCQRAGFIKRNSYTIIIYIDKLKTMYVQNSDPTGVLNQELSVERIIILYPCLILATALVTHSGG